MSASIQKYSLCCCCYDVNGCGNNWNSKITITSGRSKSYMLDHSVQSSLLFRVVDSLAPVPPHVLSGYLHRELPSKWYWGHAVRLQIPCPLEKLCFLCAWTPRRGSQTHVDLMHETNRKPIMFTNECIQCFNLLFAWLRVFSLSRNHAKDTTSTTCETKQT